MSEKKTKKKRGISYIHEFVPKDRKPFYQDKFGMNDDEFEKYKQKIINDYVNIPNITTKQIRQRELQEGRNLSVQRIRNWIRKAGLEVRRSTISKGEFGASQDGMYRGYFSLDRATHQAMAAFDGTIPTVTRTFVRWVLGIPEPSVLVVVSDNLHALFMYDLSTFRYNVYTTSDVSEFEKNILANVLNEANSLKSARPIIGWAISNEFMYLGGNHEEHFE